jgi:hypothetical protein
MSVLEFDGQRLYYEPDPCLYCSDDRTKRTHKHSALREQEDRFYLLTCGSPSCGACRAHKDALLRIGRAMMNDIKRPGETAGAA